MRERVAEIELASGDLQRVKLYSHYYTFHIHLSNVDTTDASNRWQDAECSV
jgi:hypothetical protein